MSDHDKRDDLKAPWATAVSGEDDEAFGPGQELLFKTLSAGLAGLFSTQEALRKAVGGALPPEWVEFANQQGERARRELFDRVSDQITAMVDKIDMDELIVKMLQNHVVEVTAKIRLRPESGDAEPRVDVRWETPSDSSS